MMKRNALFEEPDDDSRVQLNQIGMRRNFVSVKAPGISGKFQ